MPGLIGFTDIRHQHNKDILLEMRNLLKYSNSYVDDELFVNGKIYGSRTHLGFIDQGTQPYIFNNRFFSWFEGEFYNQDELKSKYKIESSRDNELLIGIYNSTRSFEFLRDIDGYYVAVVYDKEENKIFLITDRYGFKPLYWGIINNNLVWSSELKGFLKHRDFKPIIDHQAVEEFFDIGYLLENRTWFEKIELMPPAAILTFDLQNLGTEITHYWSWSDIKPIRGDIDERELIEEIGRLFTSSVYRRIHSNEKIGMSLSGGRDSRAILAAVPEDYTNLHTFTFGQEGCDDIKIAKKVSEIKKATHHILSLNSSNWLPKRINGTWRSDGLLNLCHMHGNVEFTIEYESYINFNVNGFAGDLVLGGSYLSANNLDKKIDPEIVNNITKCKMKVKDFNHWYSINKTDPYFINNRVRRFTNMGNILFAKIGESRHPFFDNNLIELVYGIPDRLRYKGYIYNKMLLITFPDYFSNIPWQKTGCPISYPEQLVKLIIFKNRVINKLKRNSQRLGLKFKDLRNYTNYPEWMCQESAKTFLTKILKNKNSLYPKYISKNQVIKDLEQHLHGKNRSDELGRYLTFEIWLQQVFNDLYR